MHFLAGYEVLDKTKADYRLRVPGRISLLRCCFIAVTLLCAKSAIASDDAILPEAPQPTVDVRSVLPPAALQASQLRLSSSAPQTPAPRLAKYIGSDQRTARLSAKEKLELSGWEQIQPYAFATQLIGASWEHLIDSDPQYGSDSGGFGERLGATALLQNSRAILSDGIMASIFRQDPRYRRASHRPVKQRLYHAAERVFITRSDEGKYQPNYSQLLGNAVATALTMAYYPAVSATWPRTVKGYGISLAAGALGNEIHEFTPVIRRVVLHHHR